MCLKCSNPNSINFHCILRKVIELICDRNNINLHHPFEIKKREKARCSHTPGLHLPSPASLFWNLRTYFYHHLAPAPQMANSTIMITRAQLSWNFALSVSLLFDFLYSFWPHLSIIIDGLLWDKFWPIIPYNTTVTLLVGTRYPSSVTTDNARSKNTRQGTDILASNSVRHLLFADVILIFSQRPLSPSPPCNTKRLFTK